jgi:diguanylate cyclase (GGDEF)-like protein
MLELDRFKQVKDRYGHVCGDLVLSGFTRLLRDIGPADAVIGRCGGEAFCVLLHAATPAAGHAHAQRLCDAVRARVFVTGDPRLTLTVSIGVAGAPDGDTLEALLLSADRRLYVAKVSGRDRVMGTDAPSATQSDTGACDDERTHGAGTNAAAAGASPVPTIEAASVGDGRTAQIA